MTTSFAFMNMGPMEMMVLLGLGVLLFGRKLPEVGRSLGKGIVEFKKGLKGLEDDIDVSSNFRMDSPAVEAPRPPQRIATNVPKFEDPAALPMLKVNRSGKLQSCSHWPDGCNDSLGRLNSAARVPSSHGGSHWFKSSSTNLDPLDQDVSEQARLIISSLPA